MGYQRPTTVSYVSCDWQCHLDRTPPSGEAGTDYGCAYGTPVVAPESGVVTWVQDSPANPTGRHIQIDLDDGRCTRSLHLAPGLLVSLGQRVARGQRIATSGASGNGSEWYYGPHVHQTLFPGKAWAAPTIDFERYVGAPATGPEPPKPFPPEEEREEESMIRGAFYPDSDGKTKYLLFDSASGWYCQHSVSDPGPYNNPIAKNWETNSWSKLTKSHADALMASLDRVRTGTK